MKRGSRSIVAFIFVLTLLFCAVLFADDAGSEKVYILCKSETGTLKVITTTPDKVMHELEELKNSTSGNYTVMVSDDNAEPGYYMIGDTGGPLLGGNNPVSWFERLPIMFCTEVATVIMLATLVWYYNRRKHAGQKIR